jgi:hypothetical protein
VLSARLCFRSVSPFSSHLFSAAVFCLFACCALPCSLPPLPPARLPARCVSSVVPARSALCLSLSFVRAGFGPPERSWGTTDLFERTTDFCVVCKEGGGAISKAVRSDVFCAWKQHRSPPSSVRSLSPALSLVLSCVLTGKGGMLSLGTALSATAAMGAAPVAGSPPPPLPTATAKAAAAAAVGVSPPVSGKGPSAKLLKSPRSGAHKKEEAPPPPPDPNVSTPTLTVAITAVYRKGIHRTAQAQAQPLRSLLSLCSACVLSVLITDYIRSRVRVMCCAVLLAVQPMGGVTMRV